ncbi:MAG: hypothetical protein M1837_004131 [Sclerophora amabilis]|nr:MAG: hypothetical protein M1837_004131 [Sclerophora amabilis]
MQRLLIACKSSSKDFPAERDTIANEMLLPHLEADNNNSPRNRVYGAVAIEDLESYSRGLIGHYTYLSSNRDMCPFILTYLAIHESTAVSVFGVTDKHNPGPTALSQTVKEKIGMRFQRTGKYQGMRKEGHLEAIDGNPIGYTCKPTNRSLGSSMASEKTISVAPRPFSADCPLS